MFDEKYEKHETSLNDWVEIKAGCKEILFLPTEQIIPFSALEKSTDHRKVFI